MSQILIIRPVRFLPGKTEQALRWSEETEAIRKQWGMIHQVVVQSLADREEFVIIQLWESREAYNKWMSSRDRADLVTERQRLVAYDPSRVYEVISPRLDER